ncbi:MAG: UDP-N-acetylmuramoyl-L-alanine--D-glutamate ligase [Acidimicrobiales bacterium]
MRHPISWTDLRHERVAVWGLGTEGAANLAKLRAMGIEPIIVDDHPERIVNETVLPTAGDGAAAMLGVSVVVKTPGISRYRPEVIRLEGAGVAVVGGLGLWLQEADRTKVVCVTGTKGKSTTTATLTHLARGLGVDAFAGGNLGAPPYAPDAPTDAELWVIETSSYQAADLACSPPLVVVSSLSPDHLPWHGDVDTYYRDKLSLCSQPGAQLTVAANLEPLVQRRAMLGPHVRWVGPPDPASTWAVPLGMVGGHNLHNAELARAVLEELGVPGSEDDDALGAAAAGFEGLPSRLQYVTTLEGVDCYDDSLSTNVLPTVAAIEAFPDRRIALIVGGMDRNIDYGPLADAVARRDLPTMVLTVFTTGPRIGEAIVAIGASLVETVGCEDLHQAVRIGWEWARSDGVLLLSPAAASFDHFTDYAHRARVFRDAIADLSVG